MTEALLPNWQVSVACDIKLGELFGEGGAYHGYIVEVDPKQAEQALANIDPTGHGEVLLEAVHDDRFPAYVSGRAIPEINDKGEIGSHVQVAIGGGIQAAQLDPRARRIIDTQIASLGRLERKTPIGRLKIKRIVQNVARQAQALHDSHEAQATALHELQHAAHQQNMPTYLRIQRSLSRQALIRKYTEIIDSPARATAAIIAFEALDDQFQTLTPSILGAAAVWGATGSICRRAATKLNQAAYHYSWGEIRARQREADADTLDPIIYLTERTQNRPFPHQISSS